MSDARSNKFLITISKFPETQYAAVSSNLPNVQLGSIQQPISHRLVNIVGEMITYGDWSFTLKLDEYYSSYLEIWNWIHEIASSDNRADYPRPEDNDLYADGTLTILTNNGNPLFHVNYYDIFPVSLTEVPVSHNEQGQPILFQTTFQFNSVEIVPA